MPFIVAHEFFDALPIHAFQSVKVAPQPKPAPASSQASAPESSSSRPSPTDNKDSGPTFEWREFVVSPTPPDATHASLNIPKSEQQDPIPDFQLTLSAAPTNHSRYLPESSPRYRALKRIPDSVIEICPDATMYAADIAARIGGTPERPRTRPAGAALVLDYGTSDTIPVNSLRGIRRHRRVNPLSAPGLVDISADVDFTAIAESATKASEGVEVHGPVEQAMFLSQMGIRERAEMLTRAPGISEQRAADIDRSWRRLVDRGPGGMGKVYKAIAILPENDGKRRPVGFGGSI